MTEEKKAEQASEEDWGVEKPKSGIAIETKVGLCLICILLSAFGLVVYQKINRPQEDLAVNGPADVTSEDDQSAKADPFVEGSAEADATGQVASQSNEFDALGNGSSGDNAGFSTPQEERGNPFAEQQPGAQGTDQFAQNAFDNQSEPQQATEMAANQTDNGFQQFDTPAGASNEFANPAQNEFQNEMQKQPEPAAFDNGQQDPFSGADQFAQQPAGADASQAAPQQNNFNVGSESEFAPPAAGVDSGLMEQSGEQEFAQSPAANAFQGESDPFGGAAAGQGQAMQQPQQPAENAFDEFGSSESLNDGQMQNREEFPAKTAKVNITEISSPSDANSFSDADFSQDERQVPAPQPENAFEQETPAMANEQFEQPQASGLNEPTPSQNEERFGNFQPEEFSAQQAESVTTVKRPAAAIDSGAFRGSEMTAEQVPQAQGLFDGPAPVREVSTQKFSSQQEAMFNQRPAVATGGEYTVQNGENFWTISKKLYGSGRYFQLLAEINRSRVSDPRKMRPGLKLIAPDQVAIDAQYQARHKSTQTTISEFSGKGATRKPGKPTGFFISQDGRPMYRVGSSDTLTDISQKHLGRSSRWYQIYQINRQRMQNPNKLQIGTELQLPYDASRVSLVPGKSSSR
ncbi:LysM peptidoglycan-binding domain-containing protein [uncultured Gimesia sp.]|uniref:LysM peptidoglycan-binding domain-containing protein n=1 Tax=uncultured Gimesia sp. TaxID=1678688 RepID=UPI0030D96F38|tara:strand:+ start:80393 stop:82288 length:1896 start_codon:yes stop_codon:yes gene_type:complete